MIRFALPLTLGAALALSPAAFAQDGADKLSETQVSAVARYALPLVLQGLRDKCAGELAPTGYLARNADELAARFAVHAQGSFGPAKAALLSLATKGDGSNAFMRDLPDEAIEPIARAMVPQAIAAEVEVDQCTDIERALQLLDPLPAENLAQIIGFVFVRVQDEKEKAQVADQQAADQNAGQPAGASAR